MTADDTGPTTGAEGARPVGRVGVVIGSTRPTRICPGIAEWFRDAVEGDSPLHYELVDLAQIDLPLLDEPLMAALGNYTHEHTRAWSRTVTSFDGFVFVFPQYNWGYPAPLKNALDYLYAEWRDKPVSFATYGNRGGNQAAGQFQQILQGLHMHQLADHLELVVTRDDLDEGWQPVDLEATLRPFLATTRAIDAQMSEALSATP
jgi:NAD(P)H-dependent FMN reductase